MEVAAQGALADIEVHQHHTFPGEHEAHGKVAGNERLSRTFIKRSEGDDLHRFVFFHHECHVGAQDAETLGQHAVFLADGNTRFRRLLVLRHFAEERNAHRALQVLAAVYPGVHEEDHEEHHAGDGQADEHPEQQDAVAHG